MDMTIKEYTDFLNSLFVARMTQADFWSACDAYYMASTVDALTIVG